MNKFKIIITSYNNEEWTETCLESILVQTHKDFEVLFFDDGSSDLTYQSAVNIINNDNRFKITRLDKNNTKSWIFSNLIDNLIDDTDIVLFLDGDDWLSSDRVLEAINNYYDNFDPWVSYGGMVVWGGELNVTKPFPQNSEYPSRIISDRMFRLDTWRSSHVKTMRGFIWKSINKNNFISKQDNNYILGPDDLVIMFDAMEKCPPNKIGRFEFPTYVYNHSPTNVSRIQDHQKRRGINYEKEIRNRQKEDLLPIITSELSGGIGNQLFQISATLSLAKKLNYKSVFDPLIHFLPYQGSNILKYKDNILRNIIFSRKLPIKKEFVQPGFNFTEINDIEPFTILKGSYQSEKYFDKELILNTFSCSDFTKTELLKKYGDLSDVTSIHVRRGDYLKLYPYHIFVGEDYYTKAIEVIKADKYFVFSDDLKWCKEFFKGKEFDFISDEDYNELYLISLCNNNIIANSTFSWWGAWLNKNINKKVIAPLTWFGPGYSSWDISDLLPINWIKI